MHNAEGYRSGHNGAVLKTVRAQVHAGSNPAPSAKLARYFDRIAVLFFLCYDDRAAEAEGLSALLDDDR